MLPTINILYEDENYFAFVKPGEVHSIGKTESEPSAALMALEHCPNSKDISDTPFEHGLANRLDYYSSGIMLAAKTREAWEKLRELYANKSVYKEYFVLLEGKLEAEINIDNYIGTPYRRAKKVRVYDKEPSAKHRARSAKSQFKPHKYLEKINATLCKVVTSTGLRHQVRAHAAHLGHPLCGDKIYGSEMNLSEVSEFILHASKVEFIDPWTKEKIAIEADMPNYGLNIS